MLDVKANFKAGRTDLSCRLCLIEEETQRHLLKCSELKDSSIVTGSTVPEYDDLFSTECEKVEAIGRVLLQKFDNLVNNHRAQLGSNQASAGT